MLANQRKKGFTVVELVIVIAVIAILAAVLIPTFTNIINKADTAADMQTVPVVVDLQVQGIVVHNSGKS